MYCSLETKVAFPNTALPNQISLNYVSREGLTQELDRLLVRGNQAQQGPKVVLVYGQAGFGKTQLVRDFARKQLGNGFAFRWIDASDVGKLKKGLLDVAEEAGLIPESFALDPENTRSETNIQKSLTLIGKLQQRWLLIYDNFDASENENTPLRKYFPGVSHGQIIVTSRNRSIASDIGAECLLVESLTDQEAVELFGKSARMAPLDVDSQAQDLQRQIAVDLLGRHPLAIAQAGAYIRNIISPTTWGAQERLHQYKMYFMAREAEMLNAEGGSLVREYGRSVIASWNLSFQSILKKNLTAARLLLFLGFLHHTNIPHDLFARAYDSKRDIQTRDAVNLDDKPFSWMQNILADDNGHYGEWNASNIGHCMGLLESYSLIRITEGPEYSIHPLVHAWTRLGDVITSEDLEANAHLALVFLSHVSVIDFDRSPRREAAHLRFISHLESCIRFTQQHTTLLKLQGVHSRPKLRPRCLIELHRLLDGQALNWELKVQQIPANLAVLATVSGSVHDGLDCPSTLRAMCLLLGSINNYPSCADIVADISAVMLSLTPNLDSHDDRGNRAEAHFEFLTLIFIALRLIATPIEWDDAEVRALEWADNHRDEMNPTFYLSRKVSVMTWGARYGLDQAGRLLRLEEFLKELEAELGDESTLTWSIRVSIGRCLVATGNKSEAISMFRRVLDRCPTLKSDMRFIIRAAKANLASVWIRDKSYRDLLDLHQSLEETFAEELGPYHENTLEQKNSKMLYERYLLPSEQSQEFPSILQFNDIFLQTDQFACLEARDITILQNALCCKASGRESEIMQLWDGVIDQAKLMPASDSLFQSFALALEAAAAAGDRQGYHSISSGLQKGSQMLRARKLTPGARESKVEELKRLRGLWYRLTALQEAAGASSTSSDVSKCASIARIISDDVRTAPIKAQPTMLWLVTQYIMWLFQLEAFKEVSPVSFSFLENLYRMTSKCFGAESIMTYRLMGTLALCCRTLNQEEPALRLENETVRKYIQESLDISRGITYRRLKASVTMEILVNAYKKRGWFSETIRMFEIVIEAFTKHFGIVADETIRYVHFAIELYGRLELGVKIDKILENLLPVFQGGGHEQQQLVAKQVVSIIRWCSKTEQNAAAYRVALWLIKNGNLDIYLKIICLRDLESLARKLGKEDLAREYSENRIVYEQRRVEEEQIVNRKEGTGEDL